MELVILIEVVEVKVKIKKLFYLILFSITNFLIFPVSLSTVKGLNRLSNYSEVKNINADRIYERYGGNRVFDRKNGIAYIKGEKSPFNGVIIVRKNGQNITGIFQYVNGKSEYVEYEYFENGQLYLHTEIIHGKAEGNGFEYYQNGKLKDKRFYKNDIIVDSTEYYQNGKLSRIFKATEGLRGIITGYYEDGIHKASEMNVIQDYSKKGTIGYIRDGESTAYDKKGRIMGILNYKDGKLTGLEQKVFKNGKLKYIFVSASEKATEDIKAMDYYIEYFDNSEQIKLDCKELASNNWHCKEYSKNGKFKREFDSLTFKSPDDWSFGINMLLGILNILF